jgi:hypothetical protein
MSSGSNEQSIFSDVASVFVLHHGAWQAADGGVSRVSVWHNSGAGSLRVLALSVERKYVVNMWIAPHVAPVQLNPACVALHDASSGNALALNFAFEPACTKFITTWRAAASLSPAAPLHAHHQLQQSVANNANVRPGVRAAAHSTAPQQQQPQQQPHQQPHQQQPQLQQPQQQRGHAPGLAPGLAAPKKNVPPGAIVVGAGPGPKVNAKQRLALEHDAEIDDDASPISFNRAVTRLEEGIKAVLTAAHNSVSNPSYNYDNRCEAAVLYLHQAMRSLIKLFVSKIAARRKALAAKNPEAGKDKGVIEKTMRLTYYEIMNTPARGTTEEFTLKAAVGIRRRLVLRILALRLKDDFSGTLYIGHQMLSAMNAIKLIDPKNDAPARQEGTCMLQLCATMLALTKQLQRVADGIANFGHITRDDDYSKIVQDAGDDDGSTAAPFWQECAQNEFPEAAKAYSLNQLVLKLTDDNSYDRKFMETFITTYQSFAPPSLLLQKLMERYQVPATIRSLDEKRRTAIQLRVAVALKYWCEKYFHHFDETLLQSLASFLTDYLVKDGHVAMANALYAFIMNKIKERDEERAVAFRVPTVVYPPRHKEDPTATISPVAYWYDLDIGKMAEIVTMIDSAWYRQVQAPELLNQAWNNRKLKWRAPNLLAMAARSTALSYWVATCVLIQTKLDQRVHMLEKFITFAETLRSLNNYQSLMATLAGLNLAPIHRMKRHWAAVSKKRQKVWEELNELMSSDNAFKLYRAAVDESRLPAIPYVGVHLTDLFFKEDANPDNVDGLINYRKRELVFESIEHIQRFQAVSYEFEMPEPATTFLRAPPSLNEEMLYELSLHFEPREPKKS